MQNSRVSRFICLLLFSIFLFSAGLKGQGRWNSYYSYEACFDVEETDRFVVGATTLGLIYFHKETASISVKNKVNGLSDTGISAIASVPKKNILMVGYKNGNVDVIKGDQVTNIPDLKIENMTGSKQINHFLYDQGRVFCSTDFGIVEIDVENNEIASTFIIGDDARSLKVYKTLVDGDFIYAATSDGVLRADLEQGGLTFYENWDLFSHATGTYCDFERFGDGIVAMRGEPGSTCSLELFRDEEVIEGGDFKKFRNLSLSGDELLVVSQNQVQWLDHELLATRKIDDVDTGEEEPYRPGYRDALLSTDGTLWISDHSGGLMYEASSATFNRVLPAGPYSNTVYTTTKSGNDLWVIHGGFGSLYNNANIPIGVSVKKEGRWQYFHKDNTEELDGPRNVIRDVINVDVNPLNKNQVFVASWGNGVFEFRKGEEGDISLRNHFIEENSGLQNVPGTPADRYTRIWGLTFDQDGNLFMSNSEVENSIVVYDTQDSIWHGYDYGGLAFDYNKIGEILIDNNGYKWLYLVHGAGKGIFVFDDRGTIEDQRDDRYRGMKKQADDQDARNAGQLKLWDENGEEITNVILSFAKDKYGYVWFGTDKGVVVQYNPSRVFDVARPAFTRVKVGREDGSGLADYLLEEEKVTCIAVDQANRKYFGTESAGVFLVSEDGTQTIEHFHMSNSPLPSNNIYDIHVDDESGEVFFSTDKGLIGYMGEAVEGASSFGLVYAYPNPVRPGYDGPITITGLVDRTNVKITDTAGNLVYETVSLGGNAIWNGKNLWGERVEPGIYIVFLSSPDGSRS
ncbi:MAG: two-component regulator propeller domain-containing protein, partial [Marinilabiliaceae bacterium]